jgi:predicted nucleic acid-binding protein
MILVDSSAWIEYYHPRGQPAVQDAVASAIEGDEAAVNGVISVEVVGFVANENQRMTLLSDFGSFHWLELDRGIFHDACELGSTLRGHGITVPATDLIIAASAIGAQASLYHVDNHFDQIAQHSDLVSVNLAEAQESRF